MKREEISLFQDVFYFQEMSGNFRRAQVIDISDEGLAQLAVKAVVSEESQTDIGRAGGFCSKGYKELFPTAQEAILARKQKIEEKTKDYTDGINEIKTVADLIHFPTNHIILSPGYGIYTEEDALDAWIKRWMDFLKAHPEIKPTDEF